ncbi:DsbA family protein [Rhodococcus opacus]|uniref:DsbA family protein n=1 Tax=Rhodococcus opacus TaxID=37919 RepID=UPI002236BB51|nr:thioredoxin domain-containing protein [Rhodococcus opacus]UZG60198.1 thioredoxin domain-containing protein [Rhodococcus opacus]
MSTESTRRSRSSWLVPVAVLAVAAVLIAIIVALSRESGAPADGSGTSSSGPGAPTEVQGSRQPDLSDAERRDEADLLAAGPVDAPVVLVVFSDYQCPFCARWSTETLPLMMEQVHTGDLRIEWRDMNVFGPASERAARASYAAALQGAFWEYHDALFADGHHKSEADLSDDALITLATDLGLNAEQFATDLASESTVEQIATNQQLGLDLGAYSTPVFIMGGQPIVGAQPSQVFLDAFHTALDATE